MKLKKLIAVALTAVMTMSLTACGGGNTTGTTSGGAVDNGKTYNIGICQLVQHEALDAATKGFKDALTEKLGDKVKFDEQNAQGDSPTCATIVNSFVSENVDLILANATAPLQAAATGTTDIPILGTSVTDYGTALNIKDWKGTTGVNVSGTSDLAPLDQLRQLFRPLDALDDLHDLDLALLHLLHIGLGQLGLILQGQGVYLLAGGLLLTHAVILHTLFFL